MDKLSKYNNEGIEEIVQDPENKRYIKNILHSLSGLETEDVEIDSNQKIPRPELAELVDEALTGVENFINDDDKKYTHKGIAHQLLKRNIPTSLIQSVMFVGSTLLGMGIGNYIGLQNGAPIISTSTGSIAGSVLGLVLAGSIVHDYSSVFSGRSEMEGSMPKNSKPHIVGNIAYLAASSKLNNHVTGTAENLKWEEKETYPLLEHEYSALLQGFAKAVAYNVMKRSKDRDSTWLEKSVQADVASVFRWAYPRESQTRRDMNQGKIGTPENIAIGTTYFLILQEKDGQNIYRRFMDDLRSLSRI